MDNNLPAWRVTRADPAVGRPQGTARHRKRSEDDSRGKTPQEFM
jgi:hypothetical protein